MPAYIQFGFFQSNQVTQSAVVSFGENVIQNRNSTKQNIGNFMVTEGISSSRIANLANVDPDLFDQISVDANNFSGVQN